MDAKFRTKWLKALRSGRYKQGRLQLLDNKQNTYCCLGVAAKVCRIPNQDLLGRLQPDDLKTIPKVMIGPIIGKDKNPTFFCYDLMDLNDTEGKSFKEIANFIEKQTIGV